MRSRLRRCCIPATTKQRNADKGRVARGKPSRLQVSTVDTLASTNKFEKNVLTDEPSGAAMTMTTNGLSTAFWASMALAMTGGVALAADVFVEDTIPSLEVVQENHSGAMRFDIGAAYFNFDVANGFGSAINTGGFDFIRQPDSGLDVDALGLQGGAEFWLPANGAFFGSDYFLARIEGSWVSDDEDNTLVLNAGEFLDTLPITGAGSTGAIASGAGTEVDVRADADFYRIAGMVGVANAMAGNGLKVGGGIYVSYSQLDFDSAFVATPTSFNRLNHSLDTLSGGPMIVVERYAPISSQWTGFLRARGAVLYARGDFDARQNASNLATTLQVSGDESDFAVFGELKGGFRFMPASNVELAIFGGVAGRNDIYEFVNPRSGPGQNAINPATYDPGPVTIRQTFELSASAGIEAKVKF